MDAAPPHDRPLEPPPRLRRRSLFLCCVLAALVPGLGQLYARRPVKGLVMLLAIGGLFVGGLALTGFTAVNPTTHRLEFVAHLFITGPTALTLHLTEGLALDTFQPWYDVGRLYVAVAGILNVVAAWDAMSAVFDHNEQADALEHIEEQRQFALLASIEVQPQIAVQPAAAVPGPGGTTVPGDGELEDRSDLDEDSDLANDSNLEDQREPVDDSEATEGSEATEDSEAIEDREAIEDSEATRDAEVEPHRAVERRTEGEDPREIEGPGALPDVRDGPGREQTRAPR